MARWDDFTAKLTGQGCKVGYLPILDEELLKSVASQLLTGTAVTVAGNSATVRRTSYSAFPKG
jgi:hypothetical protein